jgi:hypothetical protein
LSTMLALVLLLLAHAVNTSSGNWGLSIDPSQSMRSTLRASGSFNPAASHASRNKAAAAAGSANSSPDKEDREKGATQRRPCAPARVPSAAPNRDVQAAAAAAGAAVTAAAAGAATAAAKHAEEKEDDEVSMLHCLMLQGNISGH